MQPPVYLQLPRCTVAPWSPCNSHQERTRREKEALLPRPPGLLCPSPLLPDSTRRPLDSRPGALSSLPHPRPRHPHPAGSTGPSLRAPAPLKALSAPTPALCPLPGARPTLEQRRPHQDRPQQWQKRRVRRPDLCARAHPAREARPLHFLPSAGTGTPFAPPTPGRRHTRPGSSSRRAGVPCELWRSSAPAWLEEGRDCGLGCLPS